MSSKHRLVGQRQKQRQAEQGGEMKMRQHVPREAPCIEEHFNVGESILSPIPSDMMYSVYKQAVKDNQKKWTQKPSVQRKILTTPGRIVLPPINTNYWRQQGYQSFQSSQNLSCVLLKHERKSLKGHKARTWTTTTTEFRRIILVTLALLLPAGNLVPLSVNNSMIMPASPPY